MENMDNELTVPKWALIVQPKIPQMSQKISALNVYSSPKVRDFWKKKLSLGVRSTNMPDISQAKSVTKIKDMDLVVQYLFQPQYVCFNM